MAKKLTEEKKTNLNVVEEVKTKKSDKVEEKVEKKPNPAEIAEKKAKKKDIADLKAVEAIVEKNIDKSVDKPGQELKPKATTSSLRIKRSSSKDQDEIILSGRLMVRRPKKENEPFVISTANGSTMNGYTPEELREFRELLSARRNEILEQLQLLKDQMHDPNTGEYVNENSPYSLHMAEQGTDAQEREKLYLWAQRETKLLRYTEDAITRIDLGTYGFCVDCIEQPKKLCPTCPLIPKERLRAVPHTQHCIQVKQTKQK